MSRSAAPLSIARRALHVAACGRASVAPMCATSLILRRLTFGLAGIPCQKAIANALRLRTTRLWGSWPAYRAICV